MPPSLAPSLKTTSAEEAFDRKTWQAVAPGRVEPWSGEIRIGSAAMGRVGEVLVKVNDTVFAGEALIRLEDEEVRNRHAKAELQYNLRKRARPAATGKTAERRKHEDAVGDGESAVVEARAALDRAAAAKRAGTGSDDDLATARKTARQRARAVAQKRRAELAKFEADAATAAPTELEGQFSMARIDLRGAEAALDNLIVRAPTAGTVLQINIRAGELASPSAPQPLMVLGDRLETARARRDRRARLRRDQSRATRRGALAGVSRPRRRRHGVLGRADHRAPAASARAASAAPPTSMSRRWSSTSPSPARSRSA